MIEDKDYIPRQKEEAAPSADTTCFVYHLCKEKHKEKGQQSEVNEENEEKDLVQTITILAKASPRNTN